MGRGIRIVALAATAAAFVAPVAASASGQWLVERKARGTCAMSAIYETSNPATPVMLSFVFDPKTKDLSFVAASAGWDKVAGDNTRADLLLKFDGAAKYSEWASEATPLRPLSGRNRAIEGIWGPEYSTYLGDALSGSSQLHLTFGETDLGTYDLVGVRGAFDDLKRCGRS